ncbi:MAG: branched-chain amino acid ABC transporter permease [Deltaproteobacteria bacterium]
MADITIYWITLSLNYVLLATGLTLTISIMRVVNLAHGHFYMAGSFIFFVLFKGIKVGYVIALLISVGLIGGLGMLVEAKLYRPLGGRIEPSIICSSGVLLALEGIAVLMFGPDFRDIPPLLVGTIAIGGTVVSIERISVSAVALVTMAGLFFFLKYTRFGKCMRATAQDREAASLMGVNVDLVLTISMGIGTALAAIAGIQITAVYNLSPFVGVGALVTSILVITLGGMGSIIGAFIAAFIIGSCDSFGAVLIGRYYHLLSFGIVMIILLIRPLGLLGTSFETGGEER